jgi:hypothetical protein
LSSAGKFPSPLPALATLHDLVELVENFTPQEQRGLESLGNRAQSPGPGQMSAVILNQDAPEEIRSTYAVISVNEAYHEYRKWKEPVSLRWLRVRDRIYTRLKKSPHKTITDDYANQLFSYLLECSQREP